MPLWCTRCHSATFIFPAIAPLHSNSAYFRSITSDDALSKANASAKTTTEYARKVLNLPDNNESIYTYKSSYPPELTAQKFRPLDHDNVVRPNDNNDDNNLVYIRPDKNVTSWTAEIDYVNSIFNLKTYICVYNRGTRLIIYFFNCSKKKLMESRSQARKL